MRAEPRLPSANVPRTRSCRRVLALLLLVLLSACGDSGPKTPSGPGADQPDDGQPATTAFADTALEQAVRLALTQPTGDLSQATLHSLTTLSAAGRGISDLHGIEQLDSLIALDLSNNRIVDLTPLDSLAHLQMLDLSWNQVSDLTPLAGLAALQSLALEGNRVTDLAPLLGLPALASLDLTGNPLNDEAHTTQLTALLARGVKVWLGTTEEPAVVEDEPVELGLPGRIAFAAKPGYEQGNYDLYALNLDPFEVVQITATPEDDFEPAWSPDGRRIAFTRRNGSRRDICV
ncbi:MAG: leucine-rich repeat domain-containing protein, partial [Candidatus Latescibacterota bacterium]